MLRCNSLTNGSKQTVTCLVIQMSDHVKPLDLYLLKYLQDLVFCLPLHEFAIPLICCWWILSLLQLSLTVFPPQEISPKNKLVTSLMCNTATLLVALSLSNY